MQDTVLVWTDGACSPNPGTGGWGWHDNQGGSGCGGQDNTTNNQMELTAIIKALETYPDGQKVILYSDSQYCINGATAWRAKWKRNDWKNKGKPQPNRDYWLELEQHIERLFVKFEWVKGHDGNEGNEKADALAEQGRLQQAGKPPKVAKPKEQQQEQENNHHDAGLVKRVAALEKAVVRLMVRLDQ